MSGDLPPAPPEALAEHEWWTGDRCVCGLPAFPSLLGRRSRVHPYWQPAAGAYLNAWPHNVAVAGAEPEPEYEPARDADGLDPALDLVTDYGPEEP